MEPAGVLTVWLDLTATARHFGKEGLRGFFDSTWRWIKAGLFGGTITGEVAEAISCTASASARMNSRRPINPSAPLPDRIAALEAIVSQIYADLDGAFKEIAERADGLKSTIKAESDARQQSINEVKNSLENAATGNYATLAFGAFWLAVGVVLATLAPEIAKIAAGRCAEVWAAM